MIRNESPPIASGLADWPLGELAATLPGAAAVFRAAKLDYCCGGGDSLREAAAAKSLDLGDLLAKLASLQAEAATAAAPHETIALLAHIVTRYHHTHRRELPELIALARRVEAVHRDDPLAPIGLADLLERMLGELTTHMQKEELVLFPRMRRGGDSRLGGPIALMLTEHDNHARDLREIETVTRDFTPPEGACATWRALYSGLRKFARDLMDHVSLENNTLFPRFMS